MPKRSSKKKKTPKKTKRVQAEDVNELAVRIAEAATEQQQPENKTSGKNPAAVALGRLGGLKGGRARADKLTAEQRSDIARRAAEKRWGTEGEQ